MLVTGGAGYIGSHVCKALAQAGVTPVALDDLSRGHEWAVRWGPLVQADLRDRAAVAAAITEHRVDSVIHLAGLIEVSESVRHPQRFHDINVGGSITLLDALRETGVGRVIFSSSAAVYGVPEAVPVNEDAALHPISPYGETKLAVERELAARARDHGLQWLALRYFNAAGADADGEIGEAHDPETHLVPLAIGAALSDSVRLRVFGRDYPTPDGTAVRDFIHVSDLADAHLRGLAYLERGGESRALNVGTGHGHSVQAVIDTVARIGGRPVPFDDAPRRPGDPPVLVADPARARRALDWRPAHSDLETIVASAWRWHAGR